MTWRRLGLIEADIGLVMRSLLRTCARLARIAGQYTLAPLAVLSNRREAQATKLPSE
jgi:hypothetical protein